MSTPIDTKALAPTGVKDKALGGGLEGAERTSRETLDWSPAPWSMDAMMSLGNAKEMADLRTRDSIQNDGYAHGAMAIHCDSIVGSHFRLNARPDHRTLKGMGFTADDVWAEEFQQVMENRFDLIGDSLNYWLDAGGTKTFTDMVRLVVGTWVLSGEDLSTAEWLKGPNRPVRTAINLIAPSRLSNPDGMWDTRYLRQGIERDKFGRPLAYHIRVADPGDRAFGMMDDLKWMRIPREKPWGRRQVIHNFSPLQPGQSRGISDMVSVLKSMRMTRKYQEMVLQNAVIQASYAATIESEIPRDMIAEMMGNQVSQGAEGEMTGRYLNELLTYVDGGKNLKIDGAKVPVLFPGTKLNVDSLGGPGGVGEGFEKSLLRHIASGLGLSYEQFSRDYSSTNYSSARASLSETEKYMNSRKKQAADAFATQVWWLLLEEEINNGNVPLPGGMTKRSFYRPLAKEAMGRCRWIGAGQGSIDRLKEIQAAIMAVNAGFSTREKEIARLGDDFREVFEQLEREKKLADVHGLNFQNTSAAQISADAQATNDGADAAEKRESSNA